MPEDNEQGFVAAKPDGPPEGHPPELDAETQKSICDYVEAGNFLDVAAALSGVHKRTVQKWVVRGEKELRRMRRNKQKNPAGRLKIYVDFVIAFTKAKAKSEARNVGNINLIGRGMPAREIITERTLPDGSVERKVEKFGAIPAQWTASAWYLERTNRERWGRPMRSLVEGDVEPAGEAGRPLIIRERDE